MSNLKIISIVLITVGILLLLVGIQFKMMHWPDMFAGIYSGPIILAVGFILFLISIKKNKTA